MFGCSTPLSRENAENLIKQKIQLPMDELRDFPLTQYAGNSLYYHWFVEAHSIGMPNIPAGTNQYSQLNKLPLSPEYESLLSYGLINVITDTIQYRADLDTYGNYVLIGEKYNYNASFTNFANDYLVGNQVKVAKIYFGQITGIIENKELNFSIVNYTLIRKDITPFGKALSIFEETKNETQRFIKYDDGWRIEN